MKDYPICPEYRSRKTVCRGAYDAGGHWECQVLNDTDFESGRCPFYKTEWQFLKEEAECSE